MIGTILGNRYTILEELGTGGMAIVYKAHCAYLQRDVAIKVLRKEFQGDADLVRRFDSEARAAASLTHPNIVQIYDVAREGNLIYIVMELVDGNSLKELIAEHGPMPWAMAADVMIKIASALQKAHAKKIVHRDIKPQNILMTADGEPKVADFGIARTATSSMETMKVDTVASVHYASPEQVRGGYTDAQSDLYSAGITLYEMLTGQLPFPGDNPVSVALRQIQDAVPRVDAVIPEIPHALADIVEKCMQKNRANRYEDAAALMADLESVKRSPDSFHLDLPVIRQDADLAIMDGLGPMEGDFMARPRNSRGGVKNRRVFNRRKIVFPLIYLVLVGVIIALIVNIFAFVTRDLATPIETTPPSKEAIVGNYVGRDIADVLVEIEKAKIDPFEVKYRYDANKKAGIVLEQTPLAGSKLIIKGLTTLEIIVSKGEDQVIVPEILNRKRADVRFELEDKYGLIVDQKSEFSNDLEIDQVIRLDPIPGTAVSRGSRITLYFSLGKEQKQVSMPDVTQLDFDKAEALLTENKLAIGSILPTGADVTGRLVTAQSITPGDLVPEGTTVDLTFDVPAATPTPTPSATAVPSATTTPPPPTETGLIQEKATIVVQLPASVTGDSAQLLVFIRDKATAVDTTLMDANVPRADFPYSVVVPIPAGGGITILVWLNGELIWQEDH